MGKTRKTTNNNKINKSCYVLLSRKIDGDQPSTEVTKEPNVVDIIEEKDSQPTINLASFDRIHDATMESNELIKEIVYTVHLLRQEVADLTDYITNGFEKNRKVPE